MMLKTIGKRLLANLLGWGLVLLGIVLSLPLVPGPGFLVILIGLRLADWPFKRRFFRWLRNFQAYRKAEDYALKRFGIDFPDDQFNGDGGEPTKSQAVESQADTKTDRPRESA